MELRVDGQVVETIDEPEVAGTAYALRTLDLSAYADGAEHTIRFHYESGHSGAVSNFMVDDVTLGCAPLVEEPSTLDGPSTSAFSRTRAGELTDVSVSTGPERSSQRR